MSGRAIDITQATAMGAGHTSGVAFVQLSFNTILRLSTLPYDITWNGVTWIGTGILGAISPISETADLQANGVQLTLSGVANSLISTAIGEQYQGKACQIWFCPLNPDTNQLINTPMRIYTGRIDTMSLEVGETSTITLNGEGKLIDFFRARVSRYTDAEQQSRFPGDLGLQYINATIETQIVWGRE